MCCAVKVVHHLFPNICHTHYPAIAPIVMDTCREYNIPYKVFPNVRSQPHASCPFTYFLPCCSGSGGSRDKQ